MKATRIRVDFNDRVHDGFVRSSVRRADADVKQGDRVLAYQPGEDMEHFGTVVELDPHTGRLAIDVDWSSRPVLATVRTATGEQIRFVIAQSTPYRVGSPATTAARTAAPSTAQQLVGAA